MEVAELITRARYASPVQRDGVAQDWADRGYSCDLFVDPPGQVWRDFVHATNELVTVLNGRLEMTVGDDTVIAEPGDEIFIPRGVPHTVRNINDATTFWLFGYD